MPPYPTRSYVRAHPSFQLDDGGEIATHSPTKRSPSKRSPSKRSPSKQSPTKRSQRKGAPSERPKVKVMTFPVLREGSVQPTPRTNDPTTPQTWNPPASEDLGRAPRKLKRASNVIGGGIDNSQSWLAARNGVRDDVSPLTSMAPGRLSILPEMAEDESIAQREYARLMKSREAAMVLQEQWERKEKENRTAAGLDSEHSMAVDQGASSAISSDYPATARGMRRTDTEEVFN